MTAMLRSALTTLTTYVPILEPVTTMSARQLLIYGTGILYTSFVIYRTAGFLYHGPSVLARSTENFEKLHFLQKAGILTVGMPIYVAGEIVPRVCAYLIRNGYHGVRYVVTSFVDGLQRILTYLGEQLIVFVKFLGRQLMRFADFLGEQLYIFCKFVGRNIVKLAEAFGRFFTNYVVPALQSVGRFIGRVYDFLQHYITLFFTKLSEFVTFLWDLVVDLVTWPFRKLDQLITYIWDLLVTYVPRFFRALWECLKTVWNLSAEAFMFLWRPVQAWILRRWEQIKNVTWLLWTLMCQSWVAIVRHSGNFKAWINNAIWQSYVYMTEAYTAFCTYVYESWVAMGNAVRAWTG